MTDRPRLWMLVGLVFFAQVFGGAVGLAVAAGIVRLAGLSTGLFDLIAGAPRASGVIALAVVTLCVMVGQAALLRLWLGLTTRSRLGAGRALLSAAVACSVSLVATAFLITHGSMTLLQVFGRLLGFPVSLTTVAITSALVWRWLGRSAPAAPT
jgi:hypothetical protein